jgi:hypothetical protein
LLDSDGIYMSDNRLLIRASGLKTGIITSVNNNMMIDLNEGEITC